MSLSFLTALQIYYKDNGPMFIYKQTIQNGAIQTTVVLPCNYPATAS